MPIPASLSFGFPAYLTCPFFSVSLDPIHKIQEKLIDELSARGESQPDSTQIFERRNRRWESS
jgi:hypothetical protein